MGGSSGGWAREVWFRSHPEHRLEVAAASKANAVRCMTMSRPKDRRHWPLGNAGSGLPSFQCLSTTLPSRISTNEPPRTQLPELM